MNIWNGRRCERLELFDAGDLSEAFISMLSDLRKHEELENHIGIRMGVMLMTLPGWIQNPEEVRRWIVGFR